MKYVDLSVRRLEVDVFFIQFSIVTFILVAMVLAKDIIYTG